MEEAAESTLPENATGDMDTTETEDDKETIRKNAPAPLLNSSGPPVIGKRPQPQPQQTQQRRPKRIRKRPRSETDANANLHKVIQTSVKRLEQDGTPLLEAGGAEQFYRVVHPYPYTFASFCKKRWIGRTVLDVYVSEFGSYPENYYIAAIQQGRILVSDKKVDLSYKIQEKDVLTHTVHRHEPAVAVCPHNNNTTIRGTAAIELVSTSTTNSDSAEPVPTTSTSSSRASSSLIKIIDETDDLLIVDKPGTLPVHPCGGYHLNSLTSILEGNDNGNGETTTIRNHSRPPQTQKQSTPTTAKRYYTIHRLDRLTSGLVIFAKSSHVAKQWSQCIRQRDCQKYYLARVQGRFPLNLEHGSGLERIPAGHSSTSVPHDGEWPSNHNNINQTSIENSEKGAATSTDDLRKTHAHGFWITDASGQTLLDDVSLSDLANAEIDNLDACLQDLDKSFVATSNASSGDTATTINKSLLWLHLACPTRIVKPKNGVCQAGRFQELEQDLYVKTVKPAQTSFAVIRYDASTDSTIILCRPVTGRTHQIRLHCQYLGHSIANDPNYGGDIWYGNPAGQEACATARRLLDDTQPEDDNDNDNAMMTNTYDTTDNVEHKNVSDTPASVQEIDQQLSKMAQRGDDESTEAFIQRTCVWCARCKGRDVVETAMLEFLVRSRGIWLHALKYCIGGGDGQEQQDGGVSRKFCSFRTEVPPWGK